MSVIQLLLILVSPAVECLILWVMIKRKLRAQFSMFFNYLIFSLVSSALETVVFYKGSDQQYYFVYWTMAAVSMFLTFGVFYELFSSMLSSFSALKDLGRLLFVWVGVFVLITALITAIATANDHSGQMCAQVIATAQRTVRLIECGLLLLLVAFESRLGLSWRSHAVAISVGFGVFGAVELTMSYAMPRFPAWANGLATANSMVFVGVIGAWAINFLLPQPKRNSLSDSPARIIFQRWNEALFATPFVSSKSQVAAMAPVESFIPGVERTVEIIMARKMMN